MMHANNRVGSCGMLWRTCEAVGLHSSYAWQVLVVAQQKSRRHPTAPRALFFLAGARGRAVAAGVGACRPHRLRKHPRRREPDATCDACTRRRLTDESASRMAPTLHTVTPACNSSRAVCIKAFHGGRAILMHVGGETYFVLKACLLLRMPTPSYL
eukprot:3010001-Pleurochrysis_carterae.AAC.1